MTSQGDIPISPSNHGQVASRVFAIPELLESILLLLPTADILISQRVAKTWKTTIDGSKRLRQALFIEAVPPQTAWVARKSEDVEPIEGPNTFRCDRYIVTQVAASAVPECHDAKTRIPIHVCLNTVLHQRGHWKHMSLDDRIERGEGLRLGRTKKKILGYGRQMYLTQPPCNEVFIWIDWGQPQRIFNETGVRFWQVLEITEQAGTVLYLPHMFMLAKGVIALTESEEGMVERELVKAEEREGDGNVDLRAEEGEAGDGLVQQGGQGAEAEWNWVSGTIRRWIGW